MKSAGRFFVYLLLISLAILISSCRAKPKVYGLLLWADPETHFFTGQILQIAQESKIGNSYLVRLGGSRDLGEIPSWRIKVYPGLKEAEAAAEAYAPNLWEYAYAERDGLPLREEPHQEARKIYKLRTGQLVKVLAREEQRVKIYNYEDYWYLVLTEDGYQGFCFGYFLTTFTARDNPQQEVEKLMAQDPLLDRLLSQVWRPEYFLEMVAEGRYDLFRFNPDIGFFPDEAANRVAIKTSRYQQLFDYQEVEKTGDARYHFVGTNLRVVFDSDSRIVLTHSRSGQMISGVYVPFEQDIEQIMADERQRRDGQYQRFLQRGNVLKSTAYGDIHLREGMSFDWVNFGRLQILLRPVKGSGELDFPYFLSSALASQFDGVITLRFREYSAQEATSFLYKFDNAGVRFVFVKAEDMENLEVLRVGLTPMVIYFSFG